MDVTIDGLEHTAREAFRRRDAPARALGGAADAVADACRAMADRFRRGGTLLAFGNGGPSTDAQHVAVEFVHPVIVGKRALPALSLATDAATVLGVARRSGLDAVFAHQLELLAHPDDIAIGVSSDGECTNVLEGLAAAERRGLLTVALLGGDGGAIAASGVADHVLVVPADDPQIVKEVHVTAYHLLWELVHVFLEDGAGEDADAPLRTPDDPPAGGVEGLYPFLYGGGAYADLRGQVARSTVEKVDEVVALRRSTGDEVASRLAACARDLGQRVAAGGKVMTFGNGGSSSDAEEVAQSFLEPARPELPPVPALCLTTDVALLTALSNDVDFEVVFARQVRAFGRPSDAVIGLSTSGNSPNLIAAFDAAKRMGLLTIGFAGSGGGAMAAADTIDHLFVVPSASVHRIQEVQTTLYHVLRELTAAATAA